jgi:hypothetical protein
MCGLFLDVTYNNLSSAPVFVFCLYVVSLAPGASLVLWLWLSVAVTTPPWVL